MGNYSQLYIDKIYLSWKDYIPTFLTFLFKEEDFYAVKDEEDEDLFKEIGYRTSCKESIAVLEKFGYSLNLFAEVYEFFYSELFQEYESTVKEAIHRDSIISSEHAIPVSEGVEAYIESFPSLSRLQELEDFVRFLKSLYHIDIRMPPFREPYISIVSNGEKYIVESKKYLDFTTKNGIFLINFERLAEYVSNRCLSFPPWITMICTIFDHTYHGYEAEFPEIIPLMFVALALRAVDPETEIKLELADIVEEEAEVREIHMELVNGLMDKVRLYNRVFENLFANEDVVRERYIKRQCADLLVACDQAKDRYEKGRILERLIEALFTSHSSIDLVNKRVSTGDEEIDLVVRNNINRPFWMAFSSPLFFIECKNWNTAVGSQEIRNFEIKLVNHGKLVKIGFFVGLNGFTTEVSSELKRVGRGEYHIVLIDRNDLHDYLVANIPFFIWLETKASKFY